MFQFSLTERTVPVPASVPGKRFRRFRFRSRFLGKRFRLTRCATTLNPKAGVGWTTGVECQTPARSTGPYRACSVGILQKKCRTTGKKALAYRGKGGQNTGTAFPALRLGVVRYLLTDGSGFRFRFGSWATLQAR